MKALLVERGDHKYEADQTLGSDKAAIVLLPSGKIDTGPDDLRHVIMELDNNGKLSVDILLPHKLSQYRIIKEVEVSECLLMVALEHRSAKAKYVRTEAELKDQLQGEMIAPNSDAFFFLELGSLIL